MGVLIRAALAVALAASAGCYRPSIADCEVSCTGASGCPSGFDCVEGLCRDAAGACPGGGGDPDGGALPAAPWREVATGADHTCAIDPDGGLWCWGDGRLGQTGRVELDRVAIASPVALPDSVRAVSAGLAHTCALTDGGELYCFGNDEAGALGDGDASASAVPAPARVVDDLGTGSWSDWTVVSAGGGFTCGLRGAAGDQLYCWGVNFDGQLGVGDQVASARPRQVEGTWRAVSAGRYHACGIRTDGDDGSVWCWGWNGNAPDHSLGVGSTADLEPAPQRVGGQGGFTVIDVGHQHSCAVRGAGETYCWGVNGSNQTSTASVEVELGPVRAAEAYAVTALALGDGFTCAATDVGGAICWGGGALGQTTSPTLGRDVQPRVVALSDVVALDAGRAHACARQADGTVACWGDPGDGQLGDGVVADRFAPTQVGDASWASIAAGEAHTCGRRTDGTTACWGLAHGGRLGLGDETPAVVAEPRDLAQGVDAIAAGAVHTCATSGGAVSCWGADDGVGRLGLGPSVGDVASPAEVDIAAAGAGSAIAIHAGVFTSCAVDAGGDVYCWGRGSSGQLGTGALGDPASSDTPVRAALLEPDTTWIDAQTGDVFGCARSEPDDTAIGAIHCFGTDAGGVRGTAGVVDDPATATAIDTPAGAPVESEWIGLTVGPDHACGVRSDGELFCWGDNGQARFLPSAEATIDTPTAIALDSVAAASAGWFHSCAIAEGALACWGDGVHGKLGHGDEDTDRAPRTVAGDAGVTWTQVAAGADHTCAIRTGGTLWCWGRGGHGQLGLGGAVRTAPLGVGRPAR